MLVKEKNMSNKIGRNDLCPCKSGKKFKKCCGSNKTSPDFDSLVFSALPELIYHMSPFKFDNFQPPNPEVGKDVDVGFHFYITKEAREGVALYLVAAKKLTSQREIYVYQINPKWKFKKLLKVVDQNYKENILPNAPGETWDTCNIIVKVLNALGVVYCEKTNSINLKSAIGLAYINNEKEKIYAIKMGIDYINEWNKRIANKVQKLSTEEQLKWLADWIPLFGVDGVCYENIHEKGGISIVIFDKELINIKSTEETLVKNILAETGIRLTI